MDKKNTILGVVFIAAGIGFMFWQSQQIEQQRIEQLQQAETLGAPAGQSTTPADAVISAVEGGRPSQADEPAVAVADLFVAAQDAEAGASEAPMREEKTVHLANDFIEAVFTTRGGAIKTVDFLQTKRGERDDYVFNQDGFLPALSLSYQSGDGAMREFALDYSIAEQTSDSITFVLDNGEGMVIRRSYRIAPSGSDAEPYMIEHSTVFENQSAVAINPRTIYFNLGTARPISEGKQSANYLNVGHFNGKDADFVPITKLTGSPGFLFGIGANQPSDQLEIEDRIEWASVKNQFFASVLSSADTLGDDLFIYPVAAADREDGQPGRPGISGSVGYEVGSLAAGEARSMDFQFFIGPKEFKRLQALGNQQDLVMQFGKFFGFFSKLLLSFMYAIHSVVPSWGWSIVIMTICIKLLFWPLTAKASKSQKRMAKIQGPMAEMKEKYKDNPQKIQQETLKLFKEHQVNPVAGCLPMLIQMPIFLGLFYMLRTASELRHEPFLWVNDLSLPDTQFEIGGFPINILPMIMGVTMFLQMSMMPVSPTADPMQQKIFKFLPFIFLIFLYNFASGLVVYWTVQNILTIVQQKIINSRPDEELKPAVATATSAARTKGKGSAPKAKAKRK
ncbi:membrane protein insertase YidC [Coraliomargarita sp. SDUM461004]|uniref:Membrane protein insertase YidC n=1 Tax=Thalassobacterium sedimentorum TaxID=3041258 RepID=A0ABU1AJM3_9BACT|nr:membrane protein insertase YidC [Coraliomargarita sp. SDUM461004]MDQ8194954.1 membrane protein insertase YidC [Coraliomargarita sp. SDUM461004]